MSPYRIEHRGKPREVKKKRAKKLRVREIV